MRVSTLHIDLCNLHIMLSVSGATVLVSAKYRLTYMCIAVTASAAATATIHGLHTAEHIITGGICIVCISCAAIESSHVQNMPSWLRDEPRVH